MGEAIRRGRPSDADRQSADDALLCNTRELRILAPDGVGTQPPLVTLELRRGTCRDFALFMMEAVRSLGFAARFVTGYIYVPGRDGTTTLGGGSTHAWCQVYLPGAGWVEFDPTNGIVGNRDLIRVAVARDPRQAIPLHGSYAGRASDALGMTVQVNVTTGSQDRIHGEAAERFCYISVCWYFETGSKEHRCGFAQATISPTNVRSRPQCCSFLISTPHAVSTC